MAFYIYCFVRLDRYKYIHIHNIRHTHKTYGGQWKRSGEMQQQQKPNEECPKRQKVEREDEEEKNCRLFEMATAILHI